MKDFPERRFALASAVFWLAPVGLLLLCSVLYFGLGDPKNIYVGVVLIVAYFVFCLVRFRGGLTVNNLFAYPSLVIWRAATVLTNLILLLLAFGATVAFIQCYPSIDSWNPLVSPAPQFPAIFTLVSGLLIPCIFKKIKDRFTETKELFPKLGNFVVEHIRPEFDRVANWSTTQEFREDTSDLRKQAWKTIGWVALCFVLVIVFGVAATETVEDVIENTESNLIEEIADELTRDGPSEELSDVVADLREREQGLKLLLYRSLGVQDSIANLIQTIDDRLSARSSEVEPPRDSFQLSLLFEQEGQLVNGRGICPDIDNIENARWLVALRESISHSSFDGSVRMRVRGFASDSVRNERAVTPQGDFANCKIANARAAAVMGYLAGEWEQSRRDCFSWLEPLMEEGEGCPLALPQSTLSKIESLDVELDYLPWVSFTDMQTERNASNPLAKVVRGPLLFDRRVDVSVEVIDAYETE